MNENHGSAPRKPIRRRFARRNFLQALGCGGVVAPFVPLLTSEAAEGDYPSRLIMVFQGNGNARDQWLPQGSETDFTLAEILAPLAPYKSDLVIIDGLGVTRAGDGNGHFWGTSQMTGSPLNGTATHASIDQHIAAAIGDSTPYKSLEFGVGSVPGFEAPVNWVCYAGPGQPVPAESDPQAMFERIFSELGEDLESLAKRKAQRKSVIDVVRGDLNRMRDRHGGDDRVKIEAHLDAIRAYELRNDSSVACEQPSLDLVFDPFANDNFPIVMQRQIDLMVMAMACDLTRVATLQCSRGTSTQVYSWLGQADNHHDISHMYGGQGGEQMIPIGVWYAEQVKYLMDALAAVPEGDGTMLDHTLIVWWNEMADGVLHSNHPTPYVLAGGANGAFQTGRFLSYSDVQHNRLLVSLCHAMGLADQETFGLNDLGTGGLPGLM